MARTGGSWAWQRLGLPRRETCGLVRGRLPDDALGPGTSFVLGRERPGRARSWVRLLLAARGAGSPQRGQQQGRAWGCGPASVAPGVQLGKQRPARPGRVVRCGWSACGARLGPRRHPASSPLPVVTRLRVAPGQRRPARHAPDMEAKPGPGHSARVGVVHVARALLEPDTCQGCPRA